MKEKHFCRKFPQSYVRKKHVKVHGKANGHSCSNILMGFCLPRLAPRKQDTSWIYNPIMTSVAIPCLPTCFFLDVIKEIRDKNTSFSIYPKKKKNWPRKRTFSMVEMAVSSGTPWYFSGGGNRNSRVWIEDHRGMAVSYPELTNHIAQLLSCSQASKLSLSGPLLYRPFKVPSSWTWTVLTGVFLRRSVSHNNVAWAVAPPWARSLFWRFDSSWLCTSYLPSIATKHRLLPPFLLYFLSPPVSTFATPCRLPRACCQYVFSTASCYLYSASGRSSPVMVLVVGYAICWSDGGAVDQEF